MPRALVLRLALIALVAFAAAVAAVALWFTPDPKTKLETTAETLLGGPFALTDAEGKRRTDAEFRGKHMLVFFGFTNCPDFCPTALSTMSQALEKLGPKAANLAPIFISVDPERDTPEQLKNYAQNFDKRIVMLTGTPAEIAAVARAYRVYYAKRPLEKPGEYTVDHSAYIYLMGPGGKYLTHFRTAVSPDDLADALGKRL
ncbi:MAG TPA: SCO family protein [Alphaproteobacteria bacterium]|jgi:protein SCO1/2